MPADPKVGRDRRRVIVEHVQPEIDGGRFPSKRVVGEAVVVEADIYTDGHEAISARLFFNKERDRRWPERPLKPPGNARWRPRSVVDPFGPSGYRLEPGT